MKIAPSKLNGWQRLFAGFMLFIYIPLALIFIFNAGYIAPLETKNLLELMSTELLVSLRDGESDLHKVDVEIKWDPDNKYEVFRVGDEASNLKYDLFISKKVEPKKAKELVDGFNKSIKSYIFKTKLIEKSLVALYFLLGALVIYALGWTIGWIYKGFRKPI